MRTPLPIMMEVPYHYQFRIIVIGDTMVGKSSLLKTFSEGSFGEIEPTVGVDFFSKIIEIKPKVVHNPAIDSHHTVNSHTNYGKTDGNIIVKLQIWDTAGQERFKSIVTSYYRNSVGIVLVYDVTNRESYDHLIDWFTEVRRHVEPTPSPTMSPITQNPPSLKKQFNDYPLTSTPNNNKGNHYDTDSSVPSLCKSNKNRSNSNNSKDQCTPNMSFNSLIEHSNQQQPYENDSFRMAYLVLGCKTDLEEERQVSYEDGQAFADSYGFKFIETSSKTHYNVDQAFQLLAEEIYNKISECGRLNRLHRTASGAHLTFDGTSSQANEGIRIGPLVENNNRLYNDSHRIRLLEAQPVSGILGGCC